MNTYNLSETFDYKQTYCSTIFIRANITTHVYNYHQHIHALSSRSMNKNIKKEGFAETLIKALQSVCNEEFFEAYFKRRIAPNGRDTKQFI